MKFQKEKRVLPSFPRTPHIPWKPNTDNADIIAKVEDASLIFTNPCLIEEKIDGASVGITLYEGNPLIRNRDHILRKGYEKETAAKKQFSSIWTWFYKNKNKFEKILEIGPFSIYGEWCLAQHSIIYNRIPDLFIAYDLYNFEKDFWVSPIYSRKYLKEVGFTIPNQLINPKNYNELENLSNSSSIWSDDKIEGLYLKVYEETNDTLTHRFKMVRQDFKRGQYWNPKVIRRNKIAKV